MATLILCNRSHQLQQFPLCFSSDSRTSASSPAPLVPTQEHPRFSLVRHRPIPSALTKAGCHFPIYQRAESVLHLLSMEISLRTWSNTFPTSRCSFSDTVCPTRISAKKRRSDTLQSRQRGSGRWSTHGPIRARHMLNSGRRFSNSIQEHREVGST